MNIAEFCLKKKVTTIMTFILIIVFGIMSFTTLPLALMPDIEIPMAIVFTTYQAGPEEVENLVAQVPQLAELPFESIYPQLVKDVVAEKVLKKLKIRPEFYKIPALYKVENENNGLINNNQERIFCHE